FLCLSVCSLPSQLTSNIELSYPLNAYTSLVSTALGFVPTFFFSSRRRHTRSKRDWSSDVCSSDLGGSGASINFWRYLLNSVVVATTITIVQTFSCAMAAYAFSRLRWRGREAVFLIFLGSLMIPQIFTLLPNFILIDRKSVV